ncbi:MAG TPA: hypothetical protein VFV28_06075, partial [Limnobacter sp.]|nr:hypothetical protein [Limnobacter sp.]
MTDKNSRRPSRAPFIGRLLPVFLLLGPVFPAALALPAPETSTAAQVDIRALDDKGIYWYERLRFDLASQAFSRILLLDPTNASALRWQGLINLANGDVQAATVWLGKLRSLHGQSAYTTELQQAISLASEKRQQLAELRYQASSEKVPGDLPQRLLKLLPQAPLGEAAQQIYRLMKSTPEGAALARSQVSRLAANFPEDRRYRSLLAELGGAAVADRSAAPRAAAST